MSEHIQRIRPFTGGYFDVALQGQTYLNLVYLLLSFPLGIAYFVLLVTGFSLGVSLSILVVGIGLLIALLAACYGIAAFERQMTISLLGVDIPPMQTRPWPDGWMERLKALLTNPVTWKSLVYLLLRFPLGIASFVAVVVGLSVPVSLMAAPLVYRLPGVTYDLGAWQVITMNDAMAAAVIGALLLFGALHLLNGAAWVQGKLAEVMLGSMEAPPKAE